MSIMGMEKTFLQFQKGPLSVSREQQMHQLRCTFNILALQETRPEFQVDKSIKRYLQYQELFHVCICRRTRRCSMKNEKDFKRNLTSAVLCALATGLRASVRLN